MGLFGRLAHATARWTGSPSAFLLALALILAWAATGPLFAWSDSHSLFINTVTTCITFLMTFVIQGSQNADTIAVQMKLDELITHLPGPRDEVAGIERRR